MIVPAMRKRHFEFLAMTIYEMRTNHSTLYTEGAFDNVVEHFVGTFKSCYKDFDAELFRHRCYGERPDTKRWIP